MTGLQLLQVCASLSLFFFITWNKTFFIIANNNILVVRTFSYFINYYVGSNHINKYIFTDLIQQLVLKASLKHKSPFCCVQCWIESEVANHLDVDIEL